MTEPRNMTVYEKPQLNCLGRLKEVTFECPNWQCSVVVPPPPAP